MWQDAEELTFLGTGRELFVTFGADSNGAVGSGFLLEMAGVPAENAGMHN